MQNMVRYLTEKPQKQTQNTNVKCRYTFLVSSSDISYLLGIFDDMEEFSVLWDFLSDVENALNCTFGIDYNKFLTEKQLDKISTSIFEKFPEGYENTEFNQNQVLKIIKNRGN